MESSLVSRAAMNRRGNWSASSDIFTKMITKKEGVIATLAAMAILIATFLTNSGTIQKSEEKPDVPQKPQIAGAPINEPQLIFALNLKFAETLRNVKSVIDLQKILGNRGRVTWKSVSTKNYWWYSDEQSSRAYINVVEYNDGSFAGSMLGVEGADKFDVTFNNAGAFICTECQKPTWVCGAKASYLTDEAYLECLSAQRRHE